MNFIISWISRNMASILFIGGMVLLVAVLLYKGIDTLKGKLGFDTVESVKKELTIAKTNTDTAINTNRELNIELSNKEKTSEVTVKTIETLVEENKRTISELKKILEDRDKQIQELLNNESSSEQVEVEKTTTLTKTEKAFTGTTTVKKKLVKSRTNKKISKSISQIQISAIWTKYNQVKQTNNWS